ncbi:hypothetical protein IAR55_004352 [Kwoniella newhampshirensis]|uniref:Phosphatidic acid phosphatase type 2/haloperoxidase domain-containing protein n=1 Tax=Kwoniella newhampshirensis TaxID=1651941 RepID=A0AAW0YWU9_9TREE
MAMSILTEPIRFCFPAAPIGQSSSDLPLYTREESPGKSRLAGGGRDGRSTLKKMTFKTLVASYAFDWFLALVLWGVLAILNKSPGHKREFSLTDTSIQHSFAEHERVPPRLLGFISVGIPLLCLIPLSSLVARNSWDVHNSVLGLFTSFTVTGVVTQIIKMSVGRPRPDLIARCLPAAGATDHPVFGLSTIAICTNTNHFILNDGFKSFPSGHSSLSFSGLAFLSLYLAGKMHLWDVRGHRTRAWAALSPLLGGVMVAISRTEDNRHHWQDVLVGSLLGTFIAWVSYRTYYPALSHRECHLPLAPRIEVEDDSDDYDSHAVGRDRVRLLSEENNGGETVPRGSEEEVARRGAGR